MNQIDRLQQILEHQHIEASVAPWRKQTSCGVYLCDGSPSNHDYLCGMFNRFGGVFLRMRGGESELPLDVSAALSDIGVKKIHLHTNDPWLKNAFAGCALDVANHNTPLETENEILQPTDYEWQSVFGGYLLHRKVQ